MKVLRTEMAVLFQNLSLKSVSFYSSSFQNNLLQNCSLVTNNVIKSLNRFMYVNCSMGTKNVINSFFSSDNAIYNTFLNQKSSWEKALSDAEKVIGNKSLFNHQWLLTAKNINVVSRYYELDKLKHPVLNVVKSLLKYDQNIHTIRLIVLLLSKNAGHLNVEKTEEDEANSILQSQWTLARSTMLMEAGHSVHKSIVNIYPNLYLESAKLGDVHFGNKIALLFGDSLLNESIAMISSLRNQELLELMSSVLRDFTQSEFLGLRDDQNNPLPSQSTDMSMLDDWALRVILTRGSILGKSCQGTLKLAGHGEKLQKQGYKFGLHLALAWQAQLDLNIFTIDVPNTPGYQFSLTCAPVMLHLEKDPTLFHEINKGTESVKNIDYKKVHSMVLNGPGISLTKQLQKEHSQKAMKVLKLFQYSETRTALSNIIGSVGKLR